MSEINRLMDQLTQRRISRREFIIRTTALGLSASSIAALLSACAPAAPATPTPTKPAVLTPVAVATPVPTPPPKEVKLTFWTWQKHDEELAKGFMAKNPNIKIETTVGGPWDLQDKLVAALAAGMGAPDISRVVMRMFYKFSGPGRGMLDITDRAAPFKKDIPEHLLSLMTVGDRIYGLPSENNLCGLFYRKDIFDKYGFKAPETWDEFIQIGKTLREKENIAMLPLWIPGGFWGSDHYRMYLQSRGGNIFDKGNKIIENNKLAKETLRWYYDLKAKHNIGWLTQLFKPEFYAGMNANAFVTWPMNSGDIVSMKRNCAGLSGKWARTPFPLWAKDAPKYNAELGSSGVAIPAQTKYPEEAWKFVQFYAVSLEGQTLLWEKGNQIPSYKPAFESKEVIDKPDPYFGGGTLRDFLRDRATPIFNYLGWAEVSVILGEEIDSMWAGKQEPEQAWDNVEKRIKEKGIGR
ncbi:MAG: sugar ABC transporter substrate-binding protein [Chloroflexi bacterium]|nr:sugar ABC transporter substrate-binding protein [Chloroflexota bacterium]